MKMKKDKIHRLSLTALGTLWVFALVAGTSPVWGAVLKSVQNGTTIIAAGSVSATATITAVDTTKAFLIFGASFNDASPEFSLVSGQITNGTTLTFSRSAAPGSPAITIEWYAAEFSSGVSVQRGLADLGGLTSLNVSITAVDSTKSFVLLSARKPGTSFNGDEFIKAKLTSSTNLELTRNVTSGTGLVEWQVIEYTGATVQTGDVSFLFTDLTKTATITGVDTTKSWLIFSHASDDGTLANIGQKLVRGVFTNPTTLTFDRDNTGQAMQLTWYVIEFTDGTTVQSGSANFATTDTTKNVTVSPIDTLRTVATTGGMYHRGGKSTYSADDNPGVGTVTSDLTSGTNLQLTRALTGSSTADVGWFLVQFNNNTQTLVKQVWLAGGSAPLALTNGSPTSTTVPSSQTIVFLIYVKNDTASAMADVRFEDILDVSATGFDYVASSLVRTDAASPPADTASDLTIFNATAPGIGTALTDAVDADVGSICDSTAGACPGTTLDRVTIGNTTGLTPAQANGTLSVPANATFAVRFRAVKK